MGFCVESVSNARSRERISHTLRVSIFTGAGIRPSMTIWSNFVALIPMYIAASSRERPRRGTGRASERARVTAHPYHLDCRQADRARACDPCGTPRQRRCAGWPPRLSSARPPGDLAGAKSGRWRHSATNADKWPPAAVAPDAVQKDRAASSRARVLAAPTWRERILHPELPAASVPLRLVQGIVI